MTSPRSSRLQLLIANSSDVQRRSLPAHGDSLSNYNLPGKRPPRGDGEIAGDRNPFRSYSITPKFDLIKPELNAIDADVMLALKIFISPE